MKNYVISYAQNREDVILDAFFLNVNDGFYVDVGANHPEHDSVTKLFYEKGWRGINIEPTKRLWKLLEMNRPHDTNLNIGISNKTGELNFREYEGVGDGLSTFSGLMKDSYDNTETSMTQYTRKYKDYKVPVKTLEKVFDEQTVETINFMKVDVEGYEYEVLEGNDWNKYRPQVVCIESNHVDKDWHPILKEAEYSKVFHDGLNEYFVDNRNPKIIQNFQYLEGLVGRPIISLEVSKEMQRAESLNKRLEVDRLALSSRISEQEKYIYQLHQVLEKHRRISQQIISLAHSIDANIIRVINLIDNKSKVVLGHKAVSLSLPPEPATKQQLLDIAKTNDLQNFYTKRNRRKTNFRHIFFVITLQFYLLFRKLSKFLTLLIWKFVRKIRRLIRGKA